MADRAGLRCVPIRGYDDWWQVPISTDEALLILIPMLHRDRTVWGDDVEVFRPERFAPELEAKLPANAFKPFGNGQRACIGRQFAMQEAALVLGMILQRFELIDFANYQLKIKETLTLKPEDFQIRLRARVIGEGRRTNDDGRNNLVLAASRQDADRSSMAVRPSSHVHSTPLLVLYGSNLGTAEALATQIANDATARGYRATTAPLDEYAGKLPTEGGVLIVSASYNGLPPDNAGRFVNWLREGDLAADALNGVRFTVFGCGDRNWAATYQAVPTLINDLLAAKGAQRIAARGAGDAADDFDSQFQGWYAPLWSQLDATLGIEAGATEQAATQPTYTVEMVGTHANNTFVAAYGAHPMTVLVNRELQQGSERSTRHIELALPAGVSYAAGDHLGVLPRNGDALVSRVLRRFALDGERNIVIRRNGGGKTHLPLHTPVGLGDLLANYVELQEVATRSQIALLAAKTACPPHKRELLALSGDDDTAKALYREQVFAKHVSVLDLLEKYLAIELPFNEYLDMVPALKPRYYSIASSPLAATGQVSVTVGVVEAPHRAGSGHYSGVASSYLATQPEGSIVYSFVRAPNVPFRPTTQDVPMIMVGPGTGFAPFRGFLQERAAQQAAGAAIAPSLVFFGCRAPEQDFLYAEELQQHEAAGIATVITAFSRQPGQPKTYVQHQILAQQEAAWALIERGAVIYVCGDGAHMAPAVHAAFAQMYRAHTGADAAAAETWLADLIAQHRYLTDVWASN